MSFSDFLEGIPEGAYSADTESAIVGPAIRYGLENGLSANAMLRDLQSVGMGVQRSTFLGLVRNERARMAAGQLPADVNLTQIPNAAAIPSVQIGRYGTYASNIRVTYRVASEDGTYHLEERTLSVTSREPISPADAMGIASNIWAEHNANYPNLTIYDLAYMGTVLHAGRV